MFDLERDVEKSNARVDALESSLREERDARESKLQSLRDDLEAAKREKRDAETRLADRELFHKRASETDAA